jgi:hypothetical protein
MPGCEHKRRYSTRGYAKQALKLARKKGSIDGRHAPRTFYWCPVHGCYHLSSYPPKRDRLRPLED